jgi:predicted ribosome quality control (RQC) complex YloA/Tae2 family protein
MVRGDEAPEGRFIDMKLEMSSLDIAAITLELGPLIKGKYVDNIYQIDDKTFLFRFRPGDLNLIVEVGRRIHLTKYEVQTPKEPTQFCMALRKRLRGGRLIDVQQHEFERTVILHVESSDGAYQVVVELFRRGNLIVLDKSGTISLALSYAKMRDRNVVKNETFRHAPASGLNPFKQLAEGLLRIRGLGSLPVSKALTVTFSIGGSLAKEILLRSGLNDVPVNGLTDKDFSAIQAAIEKLHSELQGSDFSPTVIMSDQGEPCDITPIPFKSYESKPQRKCATFNEAADEYFTALTRQAKLGERRIEVMKDEQRLTRMRDMQQRQLEELSRAIKENMAKGQLLIRYLHQIQWLESEILTRKKELCPEKLVSEVQKALADRNAPIRLASTDFKKGILNLEIEKTPVSLRLSRKPQDEADRYFSAAKKAKEKMMGLRKAIEETLDKMKAIEDRKRQAEKPSEPKKRRERLWYEKFRWFHSSDGSLVLAGRDATTNELLIKKYTSPSDIILHAEVHGAPFVVIKSDSSSITDSTILEAAQFAVSNSALWKQQVASGDVYWVRPEQVSKKAPSGQYLTKGAFMIAGKRNYVRGVKLGLAVGAQVKEEGVQIIGGPPSAVQARSEAYVEVLPGTIPPTGLAKRIATALCKRLKLKTLDVDRILEFLPPGPGEIVSPA